MSPSERTPTSKPATSKPATSRKVEQGLATRRHLLDVARQLFVDPGYQQVSAEALVAAAGVTRGAMYHHFRDKREVFEALYEEVLHELDDEVTATSWRVAGETGDVWEAFLAGMRCFLDLCLDPVIARITLLDAPVVLGWRRWAELDEAFSVKQIAGILELLMSMGELPEQPIEPLAHVLVGALNQAGRLIAESDDPPRARVELGAAMETLLEGVRATGRQARGEA
jgi:AcrR family transcriptional regulator